jgi:molecular chaperone DnaK (HSP70)
MLLVIHVSGKLSESIGVSFPDIRHSVQRGGRVEIIANDQGHRITPSWVSFTDDERLVGDSAKNAFHSNPTNTVFDAKRLIGRKMDEADLKKDMKHWPFGVVDKGGKPYISVGFKGEKREFVSCILFCYFYHYLILVPSRRHPKKLAP